MGDKEIQTPDSSFLPLQKLEVVENETLADTSGAFLTAEINYFLYIDITIIKVILRRGQDSNLRGREPNSRSRRAP